MRLLIALVLILAGCACGNSARGVMRIGVDPNWYPIDFGSQTSYVNGFTEDLLIEMARYSGMEFEKVSANWDALLDGLHEKKYDAILTSMPPYEFNQAKYDFSHNFLDLGPVLIVPVGAEKTDFKSLSGDLIGIVAGDPAVLILQRHPTLIIRNYDTVPDLLNALVRGEIQAVVLDRIPAVNFVNDLYNGKLKMIGDPLTEKGLHLVTLKGRKMVVNAFDKNLGSLQKKKTLTALLKKWQLE